MKKIFTIIGARPQFIKACAVSRALSLFSNFKEMILHTGQHFDENMSAIFFEELSIATPDYNLGIGGGTHAENTGRMLEGIEKTLIETAPDIVIVYGDTDSTLAGALAAVKLQIPVAHIEAGLRSFNRKMPEEINRILTDHASTILFCPTETAVAQLLSEGVNSSKIINVGDVMYDVVKHYSDASYTTSILKQHSLKEKNYVLATIHRAENTDSFERLTSIFSAFGKIEQKIVMPLHPRTKSKIYSQSIGIPENVKVIEPVGYLDMMTLSKSASIIATDSGVQKEAFFHKVPCVTLREETEWKETIETGWNCLAPPVNETNVVDAIKSALGSNGEKDIEPFGDGFAAEKIIENLENFLEKRC